MYALCLNINAWEFNYVSSNAVQLQCLVHDILRYNNRQRSLSTVSHSTKQHAMPFLNELCSVRHSRMLRQGSTCLLAHIKVLIMNRQYVQLFIICYFIDILHIHQLILHSFWNYHYYDVINSICIKRKRFSSYHFRWLDIKDQILTAISN